MNGQSRTVSRLVGEKIVRVSIAIVGLLLLRGILSVMPMLRSEPIYIASSPSPPSVDTVFPFPTQEIWRALVEAARRTPGVVNASPGAEAALKAQYETLMSANLAVFPITIAKAVVDTLIFVLLILFGRSLTDLFRFDYARFPDVGQIINLGIITAVVGIAYHSYQGLAYPFLFPDSVAIYGWVFLCLALAPLIALGVVVARNMDAITALVMQSGSALGARPGRRDRNPVR